MQRSSKDHISEALSHFKSVGSIKDDRFQGLRVRFSITIDIDYTEDSALCYLYKNKEEKAIPETPPQLHNIHYKKFGNVVHLLQRVL